MREHELVAASHCVYNASKPVFSSSGVIAPFAFASSRANSAAGAGGGLDPCAVTHGGIPAPSGAKATVSGDEMNLDVVGTTGNRMTLLAKRQK